MPEFDEFGAEVWGVKYKEEVSRLTRFTEAEVGAFFPSTEHRTQVRTLMEKVKAANDKLEAQQDILQAISQAPKGIMSIIAMATGVPLK